MLCEEDCRLNPGVSFEQVKAVLGEGNIQETRGDEFAFSANLDGCQSLDPGKHSSQFGQCHRHDESGVHSSAEG